MRYTELIRMRSRHVWSRAPAVLVALGVLLGGAMVGTSARAAVEYPPGTVIVWGPYGTGPVQGLTDAVQVAPNWSFYTSHGWALKSNGSVVAYGIDPGTGQPLVQPPGGAAADAIAIAAGEWHLVALKRDGTVLTWGTTAPSGLDGVTGIAAGRCHVLAVKSNRSVVAWARDGCPDFGQSNVPAGLGDVVAVGAGHYHSLAVKTDGSVVAWGSTGYGPGRDPTEVPAGLTGVTSVAGTIRASFGLKSDGTVVGWGDMWWAGGHLFPPHGLSGVAAIAASGYSVLALRADGTVIGWGAILDGYARDYSSDPAGWGLDLTRVTAIGASTWGDAAVVGRRAQSILFDPLAGKLYGSAPFTLTASATSQLPVGLTSDTPDVCGVSANQVTVLIAGSCTIRASQPGNNQWLPAADVARSFIVGYTVSALQLNTTAVNSGAMIPVKFALTGANGLIPASVATGLGCTVTVAFNNGAPQCAVYLSSANRFQADVKTGKGLLPGVYPVTIRVTAGSVTVAGAATTVTIIK